MTEDFRVFVLPSLLFIPRMIGGLIALAVAALISVLIAGGFVLAVMAIIAIIRIIL